MMSEWLHDSFNCAAIKAGFYEYSRTAQNRYMQRVYDFGVSGVVIGRALGVTGVYKRIDAHRGRGPAPRPA